LKGIFILVERIFSDDEEVMESHWVVID